ncbi:MAG: bifunctional diguanylate cyclase/phosphodiesterase, partial [Desulfovibrio sp.]|nr:bifunctional diguanylate cyclase/phosphodiesterase [Desulfovibrio sp.]
RWVLLPEERSYRLFLYSVIVYHASDALWGILYEHNLRILVFIDTEIYFAVMAIALWLWTKFILKYLRECSRFTTAINYAGIIFCAVQLICVIANIFVPIFFYFDADGEYHSSYLRYFSFIIQVAMLSPLSAYSLFIAKKTAGQAKLRYRTIGLFGLSMDAAIGIQIFYPLLPIYSIGLLLGCCVLHTFVLEDAKAEYRAKHDRLTDLPNDLFLSEQLHEVVKSARGEGLAVGLLFIDLDNFKSVNNSYGYLQGDAILCRVAQRLRDAVPEHHLARSNADNFQIILTGDNPDSLHAQANTILEILNRPFDIQGNSLYIGASLGLAVLDAACNNPDELVHCAELAKFDAKKHGGNSISFYNESMRAAALERQQLETALHKAVEDNAFTVYYQPKIDIAKKDVVGCEALVRWQTNEGKWISPACFIPIAEEADLVTRIDMFVLRTACRQALEWENNGMGTVPVSVNMSVHSILSTGFADQVIRILEEENTPPELIDIEITESSFMSDMEKALNAVSRLHEAGIHIALDDFGTGYSSLQYLSSMPISFLKIDKKFVDDIFSGKETAQPLVKSIISLAHNLGMHTISEGVEDKNQLAFLVGNGAHVIQGYLFSKPLNAEDCKEYLRNRKERIATVMAA